MEIIYPDNFIRYFNDGTNDIGEFEIVTENIYIPFAINFNLFNTPADDDPPDTPPTITPPPSFLSLPSSQPSILQDSWYTPSYHICPGPFCPIASPYWPCIGPLCHKNQTRYLY